MYVVVMSIESLGGMEDGTWNKALCFVCITCTMGQLVGTVYVFVNRVSLKISIAL